jgi:glycosyltransferase involved in cell wall biosynthesis
MSDRDVFYFNTWYRGHNNARYAELLPRLERVQRYLLRLPRGRVARGLTERAWRAVRPGAEPIALRLLQRRQPYAFVTDLAQLATLRVSSVVDIDDIDFNDANTALLKRANLAAYTVTDASIAHRLEAMGVDRPWYVIPQGVALDSLDPGDVRAVAQRHRTQGEVVVGYLAAFLLLPGDRGGEDAMYNIEHLLELWNEIAARAPEAKLWLVGAPSAQVRRRLEGRKDIEVVGAVPRDRLLSYVANFDIALYPRTEDRGVRASKIAEYLGVGAPIVSYDYDVVADVREAGAGILVDQPREFVDAVVRLVQDGEARAGFAARAKAAGELRDWRVLAAQVSDVLDRHLPRG